MTPHQPSRCPSKQSPTSTKSTPSASSANGSASLKKEAGKTKRIRVICRLCSKPFLKAESRVREVNFCCKAHLYTWNASKMREYNRLSNPMNRPGGVLESRIRRGHEQRGKGEGRTYPKLLGRHEHRQVMETLLGRPLKPGEVVHHLDGDKRNNDPDNLVVLPSQSAHCKAHDFGKTKGR